MADFDTGYDHIQRRQRLLQFQPAEPAPTGRVAALRILHHQALVVSGAGAFEDAIELDGV